MALQFSTTVRDAFWNGNVETAIGVSPKLRFLTGTAPVNCAAAETGTLLREIQLDSDWLGASSGGVVTVQTLPDEDATGPAGTIGYARLVDNAGTNCHIQGTVTTLTVGTGDFQINATTLDLALDQPLSLTSWTMTAPGA